jgi:hypothetical protein
METIQKCPPGAIDYHKLLLLASRTMPFPRNHEPRWEKRHPNHSRPDPVARALTCENLP